MPGVQVSAQPGPGISIIWLDRRLRRCDNRGAGRNRRRVIIKLKPCYNTIMMKEFVGVDLEGILRVKVKPGELGYDRPGIPLDHYWLDMNWPLVIFSEDEPQAIVNICVKSASTTCYVQSKWRDNIKVVENVPPGYEKIALIWIEAPDDNGGPYDN